MDGYDELDLDRPVFGCRFGMPDISFPADWDVMLQTHTGERVTRRITGYCVQISWPPPGLPGHPVDFVVGSSSSATPLGEALIEHWIGDVVAVRTGPDAGTYTILAIEPAKP